MTPRPPMRAAVAFVCDDALKRALMRASDRTGRSWSNYARIALTDRLVADGYLKPVPANEAQP